MLCLNHKFYIYIMTYKITKNSFDFNIFSIIQIEEFTMYFAYQILDADTALSFRSGSAIGSSVNCDETHARPHFKFVSKNFNAFVHCSSELN